VTKIWNLREADLRLSAALACPILLDKTELFLPSACHFWYVGIDFTVKRGTNDPRTRSKTMRLCYNRYLLI
jgi:hypothetical protein